MGTYRYKYSNILTESFLNQNDIKQLSHVEVASILNIPIDPIIFYRKSFGLTTELADIQQRAEVLRCNPIPEWQYGFIIGTIFGDGNLDINKNGSVRLRVHHSYKQQEYVKIKRLLLNNLCVQDIKYEMNDVSCGFSTIQHPDLKCIYRMMYNEEKRKIVTEEALDRLSILGLVFLFYDDGAFDKNSYWLSTCSFTLEEVKLIRYYFFKKFGIKTTPIQKSNGKTHYWYLYFAADTRHILSKYLSRFYVPYFKYKMHKEVLCSSETIRETFWLNIPK